MGRRRTARGTRPQARWHAVGVAGTATTAGAANGNSSRRPATGPPAPATEDVEPQVLVATAWFDSGLGAEPYAASVRYTGRRVGGPGHPGSRDTFVQDETIAEIVPGTGPVSITTRVYGLQAGVWAVSSEVADRSIKEGTGGSGARPGRGRPAHPASWSWRHWAVSNGPAVPLRTRWGPLAPFASQPAVIPGIYTVLAVLSITLAVAIQSTILARGDVPVDRSLLASGITIVAGLTGAKVWYAILHPRESIIRGGWAVDGFLIVLPLVGAGALLLLDLPIGEVLDATAPGLFVAVAIGRIGCFLTGCCAGRLTAGRWGIWSSDRRVGARRVPTQLLESATGLVIGGATLALVLGGPALTPGAIFLISFAAYTVVRQGLLRLRSERRESPRTVPLTAAAAGAAVTALAVVSAVQGT